MKGLPNVMLMGELCINLNASKSMSIDRTCTVDLLWNRTITLPYSDNGGLS